MRIFFEEKSFFHFKHIRRLRVEKLCSISPRASRLISFGLLLRFLSLTSKVILMWGKSYWSSITLRLPWIHDEMRSQCWTRDFATKYQRIPWGHFHNLVVVGVGPRYGCCRWTHSHVILFSENWNKEKSQYQNLLQQFLNFFTIQFQFQLQIFSQSNFCLSCLHFWQCYKLMVSVSNQMCAVFF